MRLGLMIAGGTALLLVGGCVGGGSGVGDAGGGDGDLGGSDCTYGGKGYDAGDSFPADDGCNSCVCGDDGQVACTLVGCMGDGECEYEGMTYSIGDSFPADDGCNTCSCGEGGQVGCTLIACPPGGCAYEGMTYAVGDSFAASDGCNTCTCDATGAVACTDKDCVGDPVCELAFEVGDCDAAIPVWWHDASTGRCEQQIYGGCGGNDNRFETFEACQARCGHAGSPDDVACRVDGETYPNGSGVPDPYSCNGCTCNQGQIDSCTEIGCPEPCPDATAEGTSCAACGPADGCEIVETGCLPACNSDADCDDPDYPMCVIDGGYCAMLCG